MKKIFLAILAVATFALTATAQPQQSFWSNWSVGADISYVKQCNGHGFSFQQGASIGGEIVLQRAISPAFDARIRGGIVGFDTDFDLGRTERFARYGTATLGVKFNIINGLFTTSNHDIYLFADGGVALWQNYTDQKMKDVHRINMFGDAGLGYEYTFGNSTLFAELQANCVSHVPNVFKKRHYGLDAMVKVGYMYNFGLTAADRMLAEQYQTYLATYDSIYSECNTYRYIADSQSASITKLTKRFTDATDALYEFRTANTAANDSIALLTHRNNELDSIVNDIRSKQLEQYALPFSIIFDLNSDRIRAGEKTKLDAVAELMVAEGACYSVAGFADSIGTEKYNMTLSERRANKVIDELVKRGVARENLNIEYYGESRPFASGKHTINRKVSFYRVIK